MKEEMKKLLMDKKENYAKYVREMHLPQRSQKKTKELEGLIKSLKHPVKQTKRYTPGSSIDRINVPRSYSRSKID
jgi:hypothetical protein